MARTMLSTKTIKKDITNYLEWINTAYPYNPQYAYKFLEEFEKAKNLILKNPHLGRNVDEREFIHLNLQKYLFLKGNYILFYQYSEKEDKITLLTIIPARLVWQDILATKLPAK